MFEYGKIAATAAVAMALAGIAWGQEQPSNRVVTSPPARMPAKVAPDFRDVSFASFAQVVGQMSGRNVVLGPGVCATITARWETELTAEQFYQEFVSIAHALGFIVVEQGSVTTVTADAHKDSSTCPKYQKD